MRSDETNDRKYKGSANVVHTWNADMVDNLNKPTIMRMGMNKPPPLDVEAAMKLKLLLPLKRIASCFHVISTNNEYSIGEFC
ncbi:hypothetical protein V6N12_040226 [Hibiscus sabdariffa]|uniref:Uncharacterized protein n=1 Tax=Hibiscus sabdariffa TaxID=183260 RepID=A0ABR2E342_9ROSI